MNKKFRSFSFGFPENKYSEIRDIRNKFKDKENLIQSFEILKPKEIIDKLQKAIYFFETPLGGLGTLSAFNLFKKVRQEDIKVCLSGEGADELYGGYKYYYFSWLKNLFLNKKLTELNKQIKKYNQYHEDKLSRKN